MRSLSLATVFAAASGFIVLWAAGRALEVAAFADFQAYWGLFFAATGFIDGLMLETTRGVAATTEHTTPGPARVWPVAFCFAGVLAAVVLLSGWFWMPLLVDATHTTTALLLLAGGLVSYVCQCVVSGVLSGTAQWPRYALLVALDSGVRLVLALVAWVFTWGLVAFLLVTVLGSVSWLVLAGVAGRRVLRAPVDSDSRQFARRALSAMVATGASAILITGFPVLVKASQPVLPPGSSVTVAGLILAVTLTRAPILVPMQRFQSALVVRCVEKLKQGLHPLRALAFPALLTGAAGLGGGVLAMLLGPAILRLFFGAELVVPGVVLGVLTLASAATGLLMMTGAAAMSAQHHGRYIAGWVVASAVAFGILLLPVRLDVTVCVALLIGPLAGALTHTVGVNVKSAA